MSALTYHEDAVDAGVLWVRHPPCGKVWSIYEVEVDDLGKIVCGACEDEQRGSGYGLVAAPNPHARSVGRLMGGERWSPLPDWLLRNEGPRLSDREFRVLCALWSFQQPDDETWRSAEEIAAATGKSPRHPRQTEEILRGLAERGLVRRWRDGRRGRFHYDVRPLMRRELPGLPEETFRPRSEETFRTDVDALDVEAVFDGSADALTRSSKSSSEEAIEDAAPRARTHRREGGADDDSDGLPAAVEPVAVPVELSVGAAVDPARELSEEPTMTETEAVLAGRRSGLAAAGDGAGAGVAGAVRDRVHGSEVARQDEPVLAPPLCDDPTHCRHWRRYPNGPWTCAANHPRLDGSPPEGRGR